jgi:hypothetical protein
MTMFRVPLIVLGLLFAALLIWAAISGDFRAEGAWLTSSPWGIVTLSDLYLGLLTAAILMFVFERPGTRWLWIAPLPFLGNLWTILWLVWRLPALYDRVRYKALE